MISVVVPTKNNEATIKELLDSLGRQSYRYFEVIVADSSNDRTPEIAARYPFVRVVRVPPVGLNVARNAGVREAKGEVVALIDGDCRAPPDWLEGIAEFFCTHPDAAAVGGSVLTARELRGSLVADYYSEALWPMMPAYNSVLEIAARAFHRVKVPNGNNLAFKREVLLHNPFNERVVGGCDEVELLWRLCSSGYRIYASPSICVEHFHYGGLRALLRRGFSYGGGHFHFFLVSGGAPLAKYEVVGSLTLCAYYTAAAALLVAGAWQLAVLLAVAYVALASAYAARSRGLRSLTYSALDFLFYTAMALGTVYKAVRHFWHTRRAHKTTLA